MKNKIKRMTAMFLLFAMLFAVMPFSGSAQQLEETQEIAAEAAVAETDTSTEVIALREENVKHFDMGNGMFQAVSYGHPVHELDENGRWQDIDFSLSLNQTRGVSAYSNEAAGVSFPAVYTAGQPILSISGEGNSISMTFVPSAASGRRSNTMSAARVSNPRSSIRTAQEAADASFSSTLIYEDVLPNTDFEYIVEPGAVKENIVVNTRQSQYVYSFRLELSNLIPKLEAGGAVAIYDSVSGELRYAIPNPVMYDAAFCMSEAVAYQLSGSNGSYVLTVTADKEWINAEGRTFPVKIDPSFFDATENTQDTYIDSDTPNEPRYLSPLLWVRTNRISYIKSPDFSLPANATLQDAFLHAYFYYNDNITTGSVTVGAYQILHSWSAATLTWNNSNNYPNHGLAATYLSKETASASEGATSGSPSRLIFQITDAAKSWERGGSNYGIALQYLYGPNLSVLFKSNEADGGVFKPRFVYQYSVPGITLELKYDGGYAQRYSNAAARITSQANILVDKYFEEFGLYVSVSTPIQIQSLADTCPNDGYNEVCECIDDSHCSNDSLNSDAYESTAYHHKNFYKVSSSFASVQASNITRLIYLGHEYCYIDSEWHHTSTPKQNGDNFVLGEKGLQGIFYSEKNYGCVQNLNATENDQAKEIATLVHEFGHKLGAKDHYNEQGEKSKDYLNDFYKTDKFKDDCIYGLKHTESEIIEDLTICEGCRMLITQGIGELP